MSDSPHERIRVEVNSKCATLRAASGLLTGLSARESDEMLLLMAEEARRLATSFEEHRRRRPAIRGSNGPIGTQSNNFPGWVFGPLNSRNYRVIY